MYPVKTVVIAVLKTAAKRNVIVSAIQVTRIVYLAYRFFSIAKKKKLFEGKPKTWNRKEILLTAWGVMKPFGNPTIKTNVTRSYGIAREDLNLIEHLFERYIIKKPPIDENTILIEVIRKDP